MRMIAVLGIGLAMMAGPTFAANLLTNGDFETGDLTGWEYGGNLPMSNEYESPYVVISNGSYVASMQTSDYGVWMRQAFPTQIGKIYRLTFRASARSNCGDWYRDLLCMTNSVHAPAISYWEQIGDPDDPKNPVLGYVNRNFAFRWRAQSTNGFVGFNSYGPFGYWLIDDVVVQSVLPEPASWAMMIGGFGLVGAALRRQRKVVTA